MNTVNISISFNTLIETIKSLNLEEQKKIFVMLEDEIFMSEEAWENSSEIIEEVELAKKAYEDGDFVTLEEFITNS
jgi:hypothetical protein